VRVTDFQKERVDRRKRSRYLESIGRWRREVWAGSFNKRSGGRRSEKTRESHLYWVQHQALSLKNPTTKPRLGLRLLRGSRRRGNERTKNRNGSCWWVAFDRILKAKSTVYLTEREGNFKRSFLWGTSLAHFFIFCVSLSLPPKKQTISGWVVLMYEQAHCFWCELSCSPDFIFGLVKWKKKSGSKVFKWNLFKMYFWDFLK